MFKSLAFSFILIFFFNLNSVIAMDTIRVAITKGIGNPAYQKYHAMLKNSDKSIKTINLYGLSIDSAKKVLASCNGILFTGGVDVQPSYYQADSLKKYCGEFDDYRDRLEMALASEAFRLQLPIFGICRGLQLLNVYLGGSLIPDLPKFKGTTVLHQIKDSACMHPIEIDKNSLLFQINNQNPEASVNSYHHQAINQIAPKLKATAFSKDGSIEAVEFQLPSNQFFMAVQWHPERMNRFQLTKKMAAKFIEACKAYKKPK